MSAQDPGSASATVPHIDGSDYRDPATTAPTHLRHVITRAVDFLHPAPLRQEYRDIATALAECKCAHLFALLCLLFGLAEYEQPGWFPRPEELFAAVLGFLSAGFFIFLGFALLEYLETHTWPWQEDGFVWPWEALLWSRTVYSDDTFRESVSAYRSPYLESSPTVLGRVERVGEMCIRDIAKEGDSTAMAAEDASTTREGSPTRHEMVIPPTPLLLRGIRPVPLSPPVIYHSGLLGESPMPNKLKHFGAHSAVQNHEYKLESAVQKDSPAF